MMDNVSLPRVKSAIDRVRLAYEVLQHRAPGEKLYVAYSGGKDSECIVQVCREAVGEAAIEVNYNATGIDPPELVRHVRQQFRAWEAASVECHFNKDHLQTKNMHDLIVKKGPPTRLRRYCCAVYKENAGNDRMCLTGVRWAESARRQKAHGIVTIMGSKKAREKFMDDNDLDRRLMETCMQKGRTTLNPIVDWSDRQVWSFIHERGLPYCSLYNEGFKRLGCIGCPMAAKGRYTEFKRWPHMERYFRKAFADMLTAKPEASRRNAWETVDDVWHWWMEDSFIKGQTSMFDGEEGEEPHE